MATTTGSKRLLDISANAMAASNSMTYGGLNVATEQYVSTQIANLVSSAPGALDTLNELAAALGDDPNFATTMTNALAGKLSTGHDMTLTLNGDASGSATFTNMSNATLTVVVANDSHTHDGRYYTETEVNNLLSGKLSTSGKAADSNLLDGLDLGGTRANVANKVVRTDGNGYTNFGWINTTSGNTTSTLTDIYVNTNDGYIRKATPAHFRSQITDSHYDSAGSAAAVETALNTRIEQEVLPAIPTNNNQLTNGAGYITDGNTGWNNSYGFITSTVTSSLTIAGSETRGTYTSLSQYHSGADNLVLKGNSVGISSIFFESEKDGTNINHPSDFGFIQYHAYGTSTSGESNELIIGVSNDADDHLVFNAPDVNGMKFRIGASATDYTVYHSGNLSLATLGYTGAANANYITNNNQLTNGAGYITDGNTNWNNSYGFITEASYIKAGGAGPNTENLNTIADSVVTGELEYRGFNLASSNRPPASDNANGVITVGQHSGNYNAQLAFSSDGNMYWRDNPSTSYGSWRTVWDSDNLDAFVGATVSNDTITFTKANGGTVAVTTSDADTNTWRPIDDTPVNGVTDQSISSNWAYDHVNASNPHGTTLADLGYTGATNANYITNNNQLTNGAGYQTSSGSVQNATWISFPDGPRNLSDRTPNWNNRSVAWDFVNNEHADGAGNYAGVMTFSPWDGTTASTGDSSYQLAFINETGINASGIPGLRLRNGIDTTWNEWHQIWHSGNFTPGSYLTTSGKAADSNKLDGIDSTSFLRSDADDSFSGALTSTARDKGIFGTYDSTKTDHIWSMGTAYKNSSTGANFGNLYGIAYKHTNNTTGGTMAGGHQAVFVNNGTPGTAISFSGGVWTSNHGDSGNWKQAYDNYITGIAVTGTSTKTITLTQRDGGTLTANFTDAAGSGGDGYLSGLSFNTGNGVLTGTVTGGTNVTVDLDGRYLSLSGGTVTGATIFDGQVSVRGTDGAVGFGILPVGPGLVFGMLSGAFAATNIRQSYNTNYDSVQQASNFRIYGPQNAGAYYESRPAILNHLTSRTYSLPETSSTGNNYNLASFVIPQGGSKMEWKFNISNGYNAGAFQNYQVELRFKTSNGSSVNNEFWNGAPLGQGFQADLEITVYGEHVNADIDIVRNQFWIETVAGVTDGYKICCTLPGYTAKSYYTLTMSENVSDYTVLNTLTNQGPPPPSANALYPRPTFRVFRNVLYLSDTGLYGEFNTIDVSSTVNAENVNISNNLSVDDTLTVGAGGDQTDSIIKIYKSDNNVSNHIEFYNDTTRVGEIGVEDTSWLRINQETATNIYTPRYIRADAGFFVDGTDKGINGSGNFIGGTIAGASDANVTNWDTAYTHSQAAHAPSDAQANVQSDWDATTGDAFIKNKPTLGTAAAAATGDFAAASHNHTSLNLTGSIYNGSANYSIDLTDHGNHTWLRNAVGLWTFQSGTGGDDWTQSYTLYLPAAGSTANDVWAEIGQRDSNDTAAGRYRGLRIVKDTGGVDDGDLRAGAIYIGATQKNVNWDTAYTHSQAAHAPSDAEKNVQSDWNATSGDEFIKNKPTLGTAAAAATTDFAAASHTHTIANVTGLQTALNGKVDDSQVLTDVPVGAVFTDTVYTHPTTAGNKHIPTGGSAGQFLKYSSSGTAVWATPSYTTNTDTQYSAGSGLDLTGTTFSIEPDLRDGITRIGKDNSNYIAIDHDNNNSIDFYISGVWVARMEADGDLHMKGDVIAFSNIFNP